MDKKPFDFKDLMAFGMFILALPDIRICEFEVIH